MVLNNTNINGKGDSVDRAVEIERLAALNRLITTLPVIKPPIGLVFALLPWTAKSPRNGERLGWISPKTMARGGR